MSKQRPNLADVAAAAGSTRKTSLPESRPKSGAEKGRAGRPRAKTRTADTKQIAGHFLAEVAWQLRGLAIERRTTVQALLGEALNDLFQKHGKPEIAPVERPP